MAERVHDLLAACFLDVDGRDCGVAGIEWAVDRLKEFRAAEHFGDCTKNATACPRCAAEAADRDADAALAALNTNGFAVVPRKP